MSSVAGVICTLATGPYEELVEIARPRLERYAVAHARDLVVVHEDIGGGRKPGWGKVALIREMLDCYENVVWVDADALIVDVTLDVCAQMRPHHALGLVFHRYHGLEVPNFGVLAMRSCRWSKRFLERLWLEERYVDHPWCENAAVLERLGYEVARPRREDRRITADCVRTGRLHLSWNSIPADPSPHPRIVHFPGMSHAERRARMECVLQATHPADRALAGDTGKAADRLR